MSKFPRRLALVLAAIPGLLAAGQAALARPDDVRLAAVLKKCADYCERLGGAALDFVCLEEVKELTAHFSPEVKTCLYDYQFVRKNQEAKEKRNLVAIDGKKVLAREADLQAVMFRYENVLFGPVGLLSKSWQAYHEYRMVGEEGSGPQKTVVIEATPSSVPLEPHCYGRVWVREGDGAVLKIVWDQRSLGNYRDVQEWAKSHGYEARITAFCEYGVEKKGLRFPSRNFSEQAYLDTDKRKTVMAAIDVVYKNYKFFTVETEVKY